MSESTASEVVLLRREVARLRRELAEALYVRDGALSESEDLADQFRALRSTRTWKLMAPLRRAMRRSRGVSH